MKRNLNPTQYELNDTEREQLWYEIRRRTHGPERHAQPRRTFRPALAVTAIAATIVFAVVWQLGSRQLGQPKIGVGNQVAVLELQTMPHDEVRAMAPVPAVTAKRHLAESDLPAVATAALTGRVLDKETREPLAYAIVSIAGTNLTATTDSLGVFRFENVPAEQKVELAVNLLSYQPVRVAVALPAESETQRDFELEPMIVASLEAFDVEGAEYMVEVRSSANERPATKGNPDHYAIDSIDDALSKQAGVVMRAGKLYGRGGRSGEVRLQIDGVPPAPGSVTGGTTPPNGETVELMYFQSAGVNPFVATEDDSLSTFALDVDNASWTVASSYLNRGLLPPRDAIRVEEFVNAFDARWPRQTDETFAIHTEGAHSRFGPGYRLLRIGLVGRDIPDDERKPANLVFVIDISGSMSGGNRLGQVKHSLHILLDELREGDKVGIVVYGSRGEVKLPLTDVSRREVIGAAIDALQTGGSTNAAEGLELGYRLARENYDAAKLNRLVLCSDGVANTGRSTEAGGILDIVRRASDEGITLSTIGFGMGNYNDVMMEKLANQGDGNYFYIDTPQEGERVFRENLTGLLQTIAREAKVQVAFNGAVVQRWRLLGYENRDVADEDFRNDQVDAGEVGAGHQVTALYELKLRQPADREVVADGNTASPLPAPALRVGTVRLRWEAPAHDTEHAGQVTEIEQPFLLNQFDGSFGDSSPGMRVQTVVAEFAELLRHSYWAKGHSLAELVPVADALTHELAGDEQVSELARLIRRAADLTAEKE